jgi:prophage DNA circulation protein
VCTGCRVSESALERGIIYFTLQFTESGPEVQIDLLPSFFKNLAAFDLIDQVTAFIEGNYDTLEGSVGTLSAVTELFEKSLSPVVAMNSSLSSFNSDQIDFKNHLKDLSLEPGKCMRFFAELFSSFSKPDTPPAPLIAPLAHAFSKKNALGSDTPLKSITPEQREKLDVTVGVRLIALSTVLQSESLSEDLEDSDVASLLQMIDDSLEETASDDIFLALQRLRASLLTLLDSLAHRKRESLNLAISIPSLALCYKIYGTLEKEDELLTLNPTSNPCFMGPGMIRYGI